MNENWLMVCVGTFLIVSGVFTTAVSSGAMPGAKPLYAPPLRFRLILISFGVFTFALGVARLVRN